jgi:4-hydroxybenzoate polyprenyltransferase
MFDIVSFLAALAFAAYAKNKGRTYIWGVLPFLIVLLMQIYAEMGGGGPGEPMRTIYAFSITGFLYFIAGQAGIAADREAKKRDGD